MNYAYKDKFLCQSDKSEEFEDTTTTNTLKNIFVIYI